MFDENSIVFSWYDYIIFTGMLALSVGIGIYFGCFGSKQSTANEYLMGGKKMGVFPIAMSLVASHISGISLLAVPADVYKFGAGYWLSVFSFFLMTFVTIYVYLPVYFKLQITSTYEYLKRRFDTRTRLFSSFLFAVSQFLFLPIVVYIPALAFSAATGISVHLVTPVVCGICIFYTTIGGLKAVVWTDTLQFTITLCAITAVLILGTNSAGGITNVWEQSLKSQRLNIFDFDLDVTKRDNFWALFIGYTIHWISGSNTNQGCVQKFLSVSSIREAKLAAIYYAVGLSIVKSTCVITGLIIYAKYSKCDPFINGKVERNDQLLPHFVLDIAKNIPGFSGLFIAGVFSTALSTLSAHLNCLAGTLYEDFISRWMPKNINEKSKSNILKLIVIVTGIICTALVFIVEHLGGILPLSISLSGVTAGPLLGIFTLGVLFPKANSKGAFYGGVFGLIAIAWLTFTKEFYKSQGLLKYDPKPISVEECDYPFNSTLPTFSKINETISGHKKPFILFRISYYYFTTIGCIVTMITGIVISYLTKSDDPTVHEDLLSPVIVRWLPKKVNQKDYELQYKSVEEALNITTFGVNEQKL